VFYKNAFNPGIKLEELYSGIIQYDLFMYHMLAYVVIVLISVFMLYLAAGKGMKNTAIKYALLALAMASPLAYNRGKSVYSETVNMTSGSAIIDFLKADKSTESSRVLAPGIANQLEFSVNVKNDSALFSYQRDVMPPNVPMYHKLYNADGFDSLIIGDFYKLKSALNSLDEPWDNPVFSLLNVKYISSIAALKGKSIKKVFDGISGLYEYENPAGPAYFVPAKTGWPADGRTEKIGKSEIPLTSSSFMKKNHDDGIMFRRNSVNGFEARFTAGEKGTLVVSENYFPGWNAYENGKKLRVFKANVCFMAVTLNEGLHDIIFRYEPAVFAFGAAVSLLALGLLAAAGFLNLKLKSVKIEKQGQ
jgi:hypothetical protein